MTFNEDYFRDKELSKHLDSLEVTSTENAKEQTKDLLSDIFPKLEEAVNQAYEVDGDLGEKLGQAYQLIEDVKNKLYV